VVYKIHSEALYKQTGEKVGLLTTNPECLKRGKINQKKKKEGVGGFFMTIHETAATVHDVASGFNVVVAARALVS